VGTVLLLLAAPVMAVAAVLIKLDSKGPVFFAQERFGFDNSAVNILKFRTMYTNRGDPTGGSRTTRDDPRVTRVGRILRATSIDELPQLLNVLKGDMSLVGPRAHPLAMKVEDKYYFDAIKEYPRRHRVKPGITGWAQIHGLRGEVERAESARQRLAFDLYYIENWSLWLDLKIMLRTVIAVFRQENAF
jgi:polysaccharide biosynthesis protein PslA